MWRLPVVQQIVIKYKLERVPTLRMPSPCWVTPKTDSKGYGRLYEGTENGYPVRHIAHRFIYSLLTGESLENKILHHVCHYKNCVNPEHLVVLNEVSHNIIHNKMKKGGDAPIVDKLLRPISSISDDEWDEIMKA